MKIIKSLMLIISLLVCGLSFTGCDNGEPADAYPTSSGTGSTTSVQIASNEKKEVMDSISKLTAKFKNMEQSLSSQETQISQINGALTDTKNSILFGSGIALVIAVIAIIIAWISIHKIKISIHRINKLQERINRHHDEINNLQQKEASTHYYQQNPRPSTQTSNVGNEYSKLEARVRDLEQQTQRNTHNAVRQSVSAKTPTEQNGYFGVPAQKSPTEVYFVKLISASDTDVRFKATIRGNHAKFEPMTGQGYLAELKASDTSKLAVETWGCPLSDATSMEVVTPGEVELIDSRWEITKKAIIKLQK